MSRRIDTYSISLRRVLNCPLSPEDLKLLGVFVPVAIAIPERPKVSRTSLDIAKDMFKERLGIWTVCRAAGIATERCDTPRRRKPRFCIFQNPRYWNSRVILNNHGRTEPHRQGTQAGCTAPRGFEKNICRRLEHQSYGAWQGPCYLQNAFTPSFVKKICSKVLDMKGVRTLHLVLLLMVARHMLHGGIVDGAIHSHARTDPSSPVGHGDASNAHVRAPESRQNWSCHSNSKLFSKRPHALLAHEL
mmetsp:Transcript_12911/g.36319  ORF Transcript_12911/g.36319 Transcript_12911/m.36319 type:complete len:246 (-) Transcript_12911:130-867(-)